MLKRLEDTAIVVFESVHRYDDSTVAKPLNVHILSFIHIISKNLIKRRQLQNLKSGSRSLRGNVQKREELPGGLPKRETTSRPKYQPNTYQSLHIDGTYSLIGETK